jgi:hypothetical protein
MSIKASGTRAALDLAAVMASTEDGEAVGAMPGKDVPDAPVGDGKEQQWPHRRLALFSSSPNPRR